MTNDDKLVSTTQNISDSNLDNAPLLNGVALPNGATLLNSVESFVVSTAEQHRYTLMQWIIWLNLLVSGLIVGVNGVFFVQFRAWQMLAMAGSSLLAIGSLFVVASRLRKGRMDAAGYWLFAILWINYGSTVLLFEGNALYTFISGFLFVLVGGLFVLPKRWDLFSATLILFGLFILGIENFAPLPRYPLSALPWWGIIVWSGSALVSLVLLGVLLVRIVRASSIRVRLVVASVVLVLVPSLILGASSIILGLQGGQRQVIERLELAISLREARINDWLDDLEFALEEGLVDEEIGGTFQYILRQYWGLEDPSAAIVADGIYDLAEAGLEDVLQKRLVFQDMLLVDANGYVVAATNVRLVGRVYDQAEFFLQGKFEFNTSLELGDTKLVVATMPIISDRVLSTGNKPMIGMLVGRASLDRLQTLMRDKTGVGETGDIYAVGPDFLSLTDMRLGGTDVVVSSEGALRAINQANRGFVLYTNDRGTSVVESYRWLSQVGLALIAEQPQAEAFREIYATVRLNIIIAVVAMFIVMVAVLFITRGIVRPLTELTETALEIAAGDLTRQVVVGRMDEVGKLAQTFNSMTAQIRELFTSLESRVALRTRDLQRRSRYLEASAEVSRAISSILDTNRLLNEVVDLIQDRFALYYVGLFMVQDDMAVLRAGTGDAGRTMLGRNHGMLIGEGMIGWCISHNQARIASQAETDAVRVTNLELPDTRSEAALPLHSRGQVLGALSVQSAEFDAFDADTITVLQTLADQVAVALDNARLFAETQHALESARLAYGLQAQRAWAELLRSHNVWGYSYSRERIMDTASSPHVVVAEGEWSPEMLQVQQTGERFVSQDGATVRLLLPIRASDQVVGVLRFDKPIVDGGWADDDISLLETLTDQLGQTLERAQLYLQTQRRAARDRMIATLSSRMRESVEIDTVLRTTVREILGTLDFSSVEVRLGNTVSSAPMNGTHQTGGNDDVFTTS